MCIRDRSPTAASDRTAAKRPTYAETQKTARRGQAEPVRDTLRRQVRTAAAGATTIPEFLDRLRRDGVLVHERHSERNPGEITGYAVACSQMRTRSAGVSADRSSAAAAVRTLG